MKIHAWLFVATLAAVMVSLSFLLEPESTPSVRTAIRSAPPTKLIPTFAETLKLTKQPYHIIQLAEGESTVSAQTGELFYLHVRCTPSEGRFLFPLVQPIQFAPRTKITLEPNDFATIDGDITIDIKPERVEPTRGLIYDRFATPFVFSIPIRINSNSPPAVTSLRLTVVSRAPSDRD